MPKTRPLIAGALIAAAGLIGANGVAYAATGNALILGHKNSANAATTIHRTTHGPALQLEAPAGSAPLAVNRPVKVARLNADLVDGKDAAQLQTRAIRYAMPHNVASDGVSFSLPRLQSGIYLVSYNIVATTDPITDAVSCDFERQMPGDLALLGYGTHAFGNLSSVSASGTLDLRNLSASNPVFFHCFTNGGGTFALENSLANIASVTFIKIDGLTVRTNATPVLRPAIEQATNGPARS